MIGVKKIHAALVQQTFMFNPLKELPASNSETLKVEDPHDHIVSSFKVFVSLSLPFNIEPPSKFSVGSCLDSIFHLREVQRKQRETGEGVALLPSTSRINICNGSVSFLMVLATVSVDVSKIVCLLLVPKDLPSVSRNQFM